MANVTSSAPFYNIVLGSCWLFIVIVEDITNDMAAFNHTVNAPTDCDRSELMGRFYDIMQSYSEVKQWVWLPNSISWND